MRFKQQIKKQVALSSPVIIVSDESTLRNKGRATNEYGEIEVKALQQPCKIAFSEEDVQTIIGAYREGKSTHDIAGQFNCSKTTISILLKKHGVVVSNRRVQDKLPIDQVIAMYETDRKTLEKIAAHFGVSACAIRTCLKEHGIKMRGRWDYT